MADIVDTATRSRMMSGIRGKDTRPEKLVRKYLHGRGLRYLLHDKRLPGKPDLVFPKFKVVVEVYGCYWHQHTGCRFAYMPTSNREFWREKLRGNVVRDRETVRKLQQLGWRVIVIWECEVTDATRLDRLYEEITGG